MSQISESIQIHLDSHYATLKRDNNAGDCQFQLPQITTPRDTYLHLSVVSMVIPYSFYNINTNNNLFRYNLISGLEIALTIPVGNYNVIQLVSYLNQVMGNNMVATYNSITNKITFTNNSTSFVLIYNDFLAVLGFSQSNFYATTTTSPYCVNLYTITNINVVSNLLTYNFCNVDGEQNSNTILCNIPINTQAGSLIVYQNPSQYKTNLYAGELSILEIKLKDNRGHLINMNGQDFTMTIQIDSVPY